MTLPPEIVYYFRIFVRKYYFIAFGNCDFAIIKITGRVKTLPYGESDSSSINSQFIVRKYILHIAFLFSIIMYRKKNRRRKDGKALF